MTLSYPSHVPSTRFPTGTVLVLPTLVRLDQNRPWMSNHFLSSGTRLAKDTWHVLGGDDRDRTCCDISRRIYSPLPYHYGGISINLVPRKRIELLANALSRHCSTTELPRHLAVLGGNDPHSYGVTSHRASMNTLRPKFGGWE
jgi:hypothetical protein